MQLFEIFEMIRYRFGRTSNLYAISYKTTIRRGFVGRKEINSLIQDSFNFVTNKYSVSRRKFMHESQRVQYFNCVTGDETVEGGKKNRPRKSVQFRKMELQEFRGTRERTNERADDAAKWSTIRVSQRLSNGRNIKSCERNVFQKWCSFLLFSAIVDKIDRGKIVRSFVAIPFDRSNDRTI